MEGNVKRENSPFKREGFVRKEGFMRRDSFKRGARPKFGEGDGMEAITVAIRRVSKTREGGRQMSFSVLIVVGNKEGTIGAGTANSKDLQEATQKARKRATKNKQVVPLYKGRLVHNITYEDGPLKIRLEQKRAGTGIVAGNVIAQILKLTGMKDVMCKFIGNTRSPNRVVGTLLRCFGAMEPLSAIAARRGKTTAEILGNRGEKNV